MERLVFKVELLVELDVPKAARMVSGSEVVEAVEAIIDDAGAEATKGRLPKGVVWQGIHGVSAREVR